MRWRNRCHGMFIAASAAFFLVACDEKPPEKVEERIRAIKPYYVAEPAGGDIRRYSGTVIAANTSSLSFAVAGTVKTVKVKAGDLVKKGQLLATLDPKRFQLNVKAAKAELEAERAELKRLQTDITRQKDLLKRGWIAQAAYDKVVAKLGAAEEGLNLARSRLGLEERALADTRLKAPFDGVLAKRSVEPFMEVSTGSTLFQIDSQGAFEVVLSISDSIVGRVSIGMPVTIEATTVKGCGCEGRIIEIGSQASAANAVTVKAAILDSPGGLLPGMAVEGSIIVSKDNQQRGFLVPLVAIAPGDEKAKGYIFKYDSAKGSVSKVAVKSQGSLRGNLVGVSTGVKAGDVIAAAGVSFLRDGQRVKILGQ